MGNFKVCCSAREQGKPYSKAVAVQHSLLMRKMAARTALVFMILLFLALSFVCEGLKNQSPAATDGAESSLSQEAKVAPAKLRNRVHTILLTSRSELPGAIQADNDEEKASNRQHLRKMLVRRLQDISDGNCNTVAVATRFRSAHFRTQMDDPARQGIPLTARPVKALFILCAKKKAGARVTMTSPSRPAPANQDVVPFGNNHRRALKQFPPLPFPLPTAPPLFQFPPLPFTQPAPPLFQFPPLPFTQPAPPLFQFPPLPFTQPAPPLFQFPPLPFTQPAPPLFQFPPLPFDPSTSSQFQFQPQQVTLPTPSRLQAPPLPITLPQVPPRRLTRPAPALPSTPLPPPRFRFPPLPFTPEPSRLQAPPLSEKLPQVPLRGSTFPAPNARAASPQFRYPPQPFTPTPSHHQAPPKPFTPTPSRIQAPPLPITLPEAPPLGLARPAPPRFLLPPFPFLNIPPLPFKLPPMQCVPTLPPP